MSNETDVEQTASDHASGGSHNRVTDRESGRQESLRSTLESAWREHGGELPEKDEDRRRSAEPRGRAAHEAKSATAEDTASRDAPEKKFAAEPSKADGASAAGQGADGPPAAFAKEAKAEWANTPTAVQQAVLRREQDVAKGVEALKAKYKAMDDVMAPHLETIRAFGHQPHEAVHQLWAWHSHIGNNPVQGLIDLGRSYGVDIKLAQPHQQAATTGDPAFDRMINQALQRQAADQQRYTNEVSALRQQLDSQQQYQVNQIIQNWARDKPHFEAVRATMGRTIASGQVPLKNGEVDLDAAYAFACRAHPEISEQMFAERAAAEKRASSDAAKRARQASASLRPTSPGSISGGAKPKSGGRSVRESIRDSIEELRA
jgi:hypothetical protein